MIKIVGQDPLRTPCCGALYRVPRYASFSSLPDEFWTDGRLVGGVQPPSFGLHRCTCGSVYLLSEAMFLKQDVSYDVPRPVRVVNGDLKEIIAKPQSFTVELAARQDYHMYLNDPYRQIYRDRKPVARSGVTVTNRASAEGARPEDPFMHPPYVLGDAQSANLERLIDLYEKHSSKQRYQTLLADCYRTLGMFESAEKLIVAVDDKDPHARALRQLIQRKIVAPMRYRVP